jgi:DNA-binding phage protein
MSAFHLLQALLRFLDELARSRSVSKAASVAAMSRESAYRFGNRPGAEIFAALWDRAIALQPPA